MEDNTIHNFITTKRALSIGNSFKCMIIGVSLTSLYTQLDILSIPSVAPIFPFNLEIIMANCLSTTGVILLESYQLTNAMQLEPGAANHQR